MKGRERRERRKNIKRRAELKINSKASVHLPHIKPKEKTKFRNQSLGWECSQYNIP